MKKPFQVGDRVHCYGQNEGGNFDCPTIDGDAGTVVGIEATGWLRVGLDPNYGEGYHCFHPKQCRRIVKPREFFVVLESNGLATAVVNHEHAVKDNLLPGHTYIRVKEVRSVKSNEGNSK